MMIKMKKIILILGVFAIFLLLISTASALPLLNNKIVNTKDSRCLQCAENLGDWCYQPFDNCNFNCQELSIKVRNLFLVRIQVCFSYLH